MNGGVCDVLISVVPNSSGLSLEQGISLQVEQDNLVWLAERETDQRGQAWVRRLPAGSFTVRLGRVISAEEKERKCEMLAAEKEGKRSSPARECSRVDTLQNSAAPDLHVASRVWYHFPDRRVTALLEESEGGEAVITVETEAPDLAGVLVRFFIGEETGEIKLTHSPPETWSEHCYLSQPFEVLRQEVPEFELIPPSNPGSGLGEDPDLFAAGDLERALLFEPTL
jgi:hypothetical protein